MDVSKNRHDIKINKTKCIASTKINSFKGWRNWVSMTKQKTKRPHLLQQIFLVSEHLWMTWFSALASQNRGNLPKISYFLKMND